MNKPFEQIAVGSKFIHNNKTYTKTDNIRVSCCKSINAICDTDNKDRVFLQPQEQVEVNE